MLLFITVTDQYIGGYTLFTSLSGKIKLSVTKNYSSISFFPFLYCNTFLMDMIKYWRFTKKKLSLHFISGGYFVFCVVVPNENNFVI